LIRFWFLCNYF